MVGLEGFASSHWAPQPNVPVARCAQPSCRCLGRLQAPAGPRGAPGEHRVRLAFSTQPISTYVLLLLVALGHEREAPHSTRGRPRREEQSQSQGGTAQAPPLALHLRVVGTPSPLLTRSLPSLARGGGARAWVGGCARRRQARRRSGAVVGGGWVQSIRGVPVEWFSLCFGFGPLDSNPRQARWTRWLPRGCWVDKARGSINPGALGSCHAVAGSDLVFTQRN